MNVSDDLIKKIEKLMNLARGPGASQGEVENAMAAAKRLMDEYNIAEADLYLNEEKQQGTYDSIVEVDALSSQGHVGKLEKDMLGVACRLCGCNWFQTKKYKKSERTGETRWAEVAVIYGMPRDVAVAKAMHGELMVSMKTLCGLKVGKGWEAPHREYCRGFISTLWSRVLALKPEASSSEKCTAIVLVKDKLIERYASEKLKLVPLKTKRVPVKNWDAYAQGRADGEHASLDTTGLRAGKEKTVRQLHA